MEAQHSEAHSFYHFNRTKLGTRRTRPSELSVMATRPVKPRGRENGCAGCVTMPQAAGLKCDTR